MFTFPLYRSGVSIFALVGPLIAAALKRQFGMNAVGYWTGATLLVTTVLFAWSMYLKRKANESKENGGENEAAKTGGTTPSTTDTGYVGTTV